MLICIIICKLCRWLRIDANKELFNTYWKQFPMSWFDYVTNRYNIFDNDIKNNIISVAVMFYSCVNDYGKILFKSIINHININASKLNSNIIFQTDY